MSRLEAMLAERPASSHGMAAVLVCVLIGSFLVWASTAQLDEVSVATGEVVPQGQLKVVQHFEGGIVQRIDVAEGDSVIKGQVLVQLDLAGGGVNREELIVQLDALTLRRVRLKAQVEGRAPVFPKAEAERRATQAFIAELVAERFSVPEAEDAVRAVGLDKAAARNHIAIKRQQEKERREAEAAARERFVGCVKMVLDAGADVNATLTARTPGGGAAASALSASSAASSAASVR